jgi:ABC-2 type transport system permease protein
VFAITAMASLVAAEESTGRLDMVLSNPLQRRSVMMHKASAVFALMGVVVAVLLAVVLYGNMQWDLGMDLYAMVAANIGLGLLGLAFWGIAVAIWAVVGGSGPAVGATAAVAVVSYFLNGLGAVVDVLEPFRYLSPFYWFLGDTVPLSKGLTWGYLALAVLAVAGTALATARFRTRNLAV